MKRPASFALRSSRWGRSVLAFVSLLSSLLSADEQPPFPPFYHSDAPYRELLEAPLLAPLDPPPTGLTLPHHILAIDLIAEGLSLARGGDYERIVLISPDHFRRGKTAASVAQRDFRTVLGYIPTDRRAVERIVDDRLISVSSLASHEHGLRAILPFFAAWFPDTPVVAVTVGIRTSPDEWIQIADALEPIISAKTLVVQSTDFSHYLTPPVARSKDAETLVRLAQESVESIKLLNQPDHADSKAAQAIQTLLQTRRGASLAIINNRNSAHYAGPNDDLRETTSYITQVWRPQFVPASALPGKTWFFGGDFHLGRRLAEIIKDPKAVAFFTDSVLRHTDGAPLVLNLEGVLAETLPEAKTLHPMQIVMPTAPTLDLLKRWKVAGLVVANNHTLDLGKEARAETIRTLKSAGFQVIGESEIVSFSDFDLFAASDVRNYPTPATDLLRAHHLPELTPIPLSYPHRPRLAFLHWGLEYRVGPNERQRWLADYFAKAQYDLLIGCHSHIPSSHLHLEDRLPVLPSLGNFLFDQAREERGGALLEVRFFEQGSFATRLIPLGNLYREWQRQ